MLTVNEIIHNYKGIQHQSYNKTNNIPTIKNNLQKIKCHISNNLKRHQLELIRSNRKLCFYSIFKTDVSNSHYLEQIKNSKHRRAVVGSPDVIPLETLSLPINKDHGLYSLLVKIFKYGSSILSNQLASI